MTKYKIRCSITNMKKLIVMSLVVLTMTTFAPKEANAYYPCNLTNPSWTGNCEGCQNLPASECQTNCNPTWSGYDCTSYLHRKNNQNLPSTCVVDTPYTFTVTPEVTQCSCPLNTIMTDMGSMPGNHKFTCKTQTQTCWNGTVIPIHQNCPTYQPTCPYNYSWNGYQCTVNYQPQPYYNQYQSYQPYYYYQSYPIYYPYQTTDNEWNWSNNWNWMYQDNNYYYW